MVIYMTFIPYGNNKHASIRPPIKWAGGKGQLIPQFEQLFPGRIDCLAEPFFGGGAVFFHLLPRQAVLLDTNKELINFYLVVRNNLESLLLDLRRHQNTAEYYYRLRALEPDSIDDVQRASRFLYLNKTGYNGLWRVNSKGRHNVPYGRYKNPKILDEESLRKVSAVLQGTEIMCADFSHILDIARPGMFIYMDPPYHPLSDTAKFTSYTAESFREKDQSRLAGVFQELDRRGCLVMLSNSDSVFIRELYAEYNITVVTAKRNINCRPEGRNPITELVIRNYGTAQRRRRDGGAGLSPIK